MPQTHILYDSIAYLWNDKVLEVELRLNELETAADTSNQA